MKQIVASSLLVRQNLSADKRIFTKSRNLVKSHKYVICGARRRLTQSIHRLAKGANLNSANNFKNGNTWFFDET